MTKTSFDLYDYWQTVNAFGHIYAGEKSRFDELLMRKRKAELCALLHKVIQNELDEKDRLLIRLHWYQGKTPDDLKNELSNRQNTGSTLRRCRSRLCLSRQELGALVGVPETRIEQLEKSADTMTVGELRTFMNLFGLSADSLLFGDSERG